MRRVQICVLAILSLLVSGAAWAADQPPQFKDCPFTGVMPDYQPTGPVTWENWNSRTMRIVEGTDEKDLEVTGVVCVQNYDELQGKTEGSTLEITENFKEAFEQQGAEIKVNRPGIVVAHLTKDGKEYWIRLGSSRDDSYGIVEVEVEPFMRTLLPPSGNDFRLLGHMPGYVADTPNKKHYDEFSFPTDNGQVAVRGALFSVNYHPPEKQARPIAEKEVVENYRQALKDLGAEFLRSDDGIVTARLDDHGQTVYVMATGGRVVAVDEKPFQLSIQPPKADEMKDKLEKEGHIALYVNFDFNKASLKPDAAPIIAQVVELLKNNPDLKVSIDGHTDIIGGHDYNVKLSQDRAASVVAAIVAGGVDAGRLKSAGYGPDKPIAPNDTEENRAKNRRVELVKAS